MTAVPIRIDEHRLAPGAVHPEGGLEPHLLALQAAGANAYAASGKEHYANCQFARAIADFDQAISLDAQDADTHYNRGLAWYAKGDLRRAIGGFDEALSLNAQIADAYFHRGSALSDRGEHERAIADFDRALAIDPSHRLAENRKWLAAENLAARIRPIQAGPKKKKRWFGLFSW